MIKELEKFITSRKAKGCRPATMDWYRYNLESFSRYVGDSGQNWKSKETVLNYLARQQTEHTASTCAARLRAIRTFFRFFELGRELEGIERPIQRRRPPRRATQKQLSELLESITGEEWRDHRDRLIIALFGYTGIRVGELLRLKGDAFQIETLIIEEGKRDSRIIPLLPKVYVLFTMYREQVSRETLFIGQRPGSPPAPLTPSGVRQILQRRCNAAHLPYLNPHAFRHGLAIYLLNQTGEMAMIQRILGHRQITTTAELYARWETAGLCRAFFGCFNQP